jgi:hypothetical protein
MRQSLAKKPIEVEGVLDIYVIQPLGAVLTYWLRHTGITPNGVSWLSVVAALAAAVAFYEPTWSGAAAGSLLLLVSSGLDSADGQLARATGRTSELGETLDGFCDSLAFGMIYLSAALSLIVHSGISPAVALPRGVLAGASHSVQSALVDFERQLFVYFLRGTGRVQRENPTRLREELAKARREGEPSLQLLLRWLRIRYCVTQQNWLATSTDLLRAYATIHPDSRARAWFADRYRRAMRRPLQSWTLMAPNSHKVAIAVCAFMPVLAPGWPPAQYGLGLVFSFNLALNLVLVLLIRMQRRIDRRLMRDIAAAPDLRT